MRRTLVAFSTIASSIMAISTCQYAQALDNLFGSNDLFPAETEKPMFSDFKMASPDQAVSNPEVKQDPKARKKAFDDMVSHDDEQMRNQMQKVASWLQEFSLRNQNRFPGVYGSSNTIERASEVQLTELVGANPYANAASATVQDRELNGLSPGLSYYYNSDGTPNVTGPIANDEWTSELTADNAHRIKLDTDENISSTTLDSYRRETLSSWQEAPGCIVAKGDGEGNFYVWGAGIDGKPIKEYGSQTNYIIFDQTANNVEDQGQETSY